MSWLSPISWNKLILKLKKLGFDGPFSWWKHLFMSKDNLDLTIPNKHSNKDIWISLLSRILKQANITIDKWNNMK
jgi:predicted RNA binding protein YcfA (HicA-like mRNA interferase family)